MLAMSQEIQAARRLGVGASEVAAILGLDHWRGQHSVWLEKTGRAPPREDTEDTLFGKAAEGAAIKLYEHHTGAHVEKCGNFVHPKYKIARATPDGLVGDGKTLQVKCPRYGTGWGDSGTHDFPSKIWLQITWEMSCAQRTSADVIALIGRSVSIYPDCPYDDELFLRILEPVERFWRDYVVADREPPLDGTRDTTEWLRAQYPTNANDAYIYDDSAEMRRLVADYATAKEQQKLAETRVSELHNQLAARIGEAAGIEGSNYSVSFKTTKKVTFDYKAALAGLGVSEQALQPYAKFSQYRTLRLNRCK